MKHLSRHVALLATTVLALSSGAAFAKEQGPRPMFVVHPHLQSNMKMPHARSSFPGSWQYTYTYNNKQYTETWIGTNPSTATSETIPIYLIPLKISYTDSSGKKTVEAAKKIIKSTIASPIFTPLDFKFGGTDIGTTQYEDAMQKANVWSIGGSASGYHVLLGAPTVEKQQNLTVPTAQGAVFTAFGASVIGVSINWFDPQITALITKLKIPANSLPIFVTSEVYLTEGTGSQNCCIGGYHDEFKGQPYSYFTYITKTGAFSQDVSALSHELAEWIDDPYVDNNSPCGIYENGDPLEGEANYGDYPYVLNGVTYHLQDIALLPYFGGGPGVTLANLITLQGTKLSVCQNGS